MEGGPWTWVSRADSSADSCLDFVIMSADLAPFLKRMVIDQNKKFSPARARIIKRKKTMIYSDHHPVLVEFENFPKGWISKKPTCSWNRVKPGGWGRYKDLSEAASEEGGEVSRHDDKVQAAFHATICPTHTCPGPALHLF